MTGGPQLAVGFLESTRYITQRVSLNIPPEMPPIKNELPSAKQFHNIITANSKTPAFYG